MNVATIAPTQKSIVHHMGTARLTGTQVAIEKFTGNAVAKPASAPSLSAVAGPARRV